MSQIIECNNNEGCFAIIEYENDSFIQGVHVIPTSVTSVSIEGIVSKFNTHKEANDYLKQGKKTQKRFFYKFNTWFFDDK
ncbi:hypothetical protein HX071_08560 [Myroides marinus]|uniref:hypothetical protein n=1 Tax=Myroides marinus TaxID=703342 RepID=UPI0025786064|nr:hypothetical protein [Myroides marinus]MDM1502255.1 hypothetical protein [Myroides marinus]